jgi:HupE / UreJ protein
VVGIASTPAVLAADLSEGQGALPPGPPLGPEAPDPHLLSGGGFGNWGRGRAICSSVLRRIIVAVLGFCLLLLYAAGAAAHIRSESYSSWVISGATIYLTITVPDIEARRLATAGTTRPTDQELTQYLLVHIIVADNGAACGLASRPEPVAATPGFRKVEFSFACRDTRSLRIGTSAFFELVPAHVDMAQIQTDNGDFIEQLFTSDQQAFDVSGGDSTNRLQNAGFLEYVRMGVMHIFTGVDHQSFLLGLVLISRRLRDLVFVITGFTLGHSATLALAVTGLIRPHAEYIDALIGLTIALIGAENVADTTHRPEAVIAGGALLFAAMIGAKLAGLGGLPLTLLVGIGIFGANYLRISGHLRDAARLRIVVTVIFGLVHGFGFASDLLQLKLPVGRLAELLVGFNCGVEIGQLSLVVGVVLLVMVLGRLRLTLPRPIVIDVGSAALVGLGLFWFVSRSYV